MDVSITQHTKNFWRGLNLIPIFFGKQIYLIYSEIVQVCIVYRQSNYFSPLSIETHKYLII